MVARAVEVLQAVESCFVVLVRGRLIVRSQEGEYRRDIRIRASHEPIDGAYDALVNFSLTLEIWVFWVGWWDGVYWEA